jgi:hypothetical protein
VLVVGAGISLDRLVVAPRDRRQGKANGINVYSQVAACGASTGSTP